MSETCLYKVRALMHGPALMIIAGILEISINLLLVLQVIVCLMVSLLVLMQRPKNEGLGAAFGSGTTDSVFGAGTTSVLQTGTKWFGILFFGVTLLLGILISNRDKNPNLGGEIEAAPAVLEAPVVEAEVDPVAELEALENASTETTDAPAVEAEVVPEAPEAEAGVVPEIEAAAEVPAAEVPVADLPDLASPGVTEIPAEGLVIPAEVVEVPEVDAPKVPLIELEEPAAPEE